jgi:type IV secretory pathway TrbD component
MTGQRYRRSPAALHRTVGHEVLLAGADRESFDVLPGTAASVWTLLEKSATLPELSDELARTYGTPVERIVADVAPLLDELVRRGWLERIDED